MTKKATKMNPLDAALHHTSKVAAQRKQEDHQLWEAWKQDPTEVTLQPLMRRFEPVFVQKMQQYKAPNVSAPAFKTNLKVQAIKAFQTYDPARGAALRTHVENGLKRSMRFNAQHQNNAYIAEGQVAYIGALDRAHENLFEELGREPSHPEVAQYINQDPNLLGGKKPLTPAMVARIQGSRRRDILSSSMETDPTDFEQDRNRQILGLIPTELAGNHVQVFNHLYGIDGAKRISSTGALARQLDMSPSQVSRIKSSIADTYRRHLYGGK